MPRWMVGIDTGGTFTDLVAFERDSQEVRVLKVPSTTSDPSNACIVALKELFATGVDAASVSFLVHGTTVATNAMLEGKGVRTGLLITEGFRAVYEAGSSKRPSASRLLDPAYERPPLLVSQWMTGEVPERIGHDGQVLKVLDENRVREEIRALKQRGMEALAVCYLFSFRNSAHEDRTAAIAAEEAGCRVSLSSRVLPTIREYPRLSTTIVDAYVGPIMERYLTYLGERLRDIGVTTKQVYLMQSNGGFMRVNVAARFPNETLLSGPAAGVVFGREIAALDNHGNVVTFDMGGTSTDISVIIDGKVEETTQSQIAGYDVGTPAVSIHSLGAGGGTIAWIGPDGLLKVGPASSGAEPGPACYGRGGTEPTVTDANLVLGALGTENRLAGRIGLSSELSRDAIKRVVADPLGLSIEEAAAGIIRIVNNKMAADLRINLQDRGQDPRRFTLVAFGGAGPLHAPALAIELKIPRVVIPLHPGLACAMGLLKSHVKHIYVQSSLGLLDRFPIERLKEIFAGLQERAAADVRDEGFAVSEMNVRRQVDLRYRRQGYEISIDCPGGLLTENDKANLKRSFDQAHQRMYGISAAEESVEVVTLRLIAEVMIDHPDFPVIEQGSSDAARAIKNERPLYDLVNRKFRAAPVFDRSKLRAGDHFVGPAVVEQTDSTTGVNDGQAVTVDRYGNLIVRTELVA